jgi:hypothetical protein
MRKIDLGVFSQKKLAEYAGLYAKLSAILRAVGYE